jgi:glycine hydroxymethyltransferase
MVLSDLRNKGITGKDAEASLELAGITANKNMVPFDTESPFVTSGIRLGTPAITTRGMKESEMEFIVESIDNALMERENPKALAELKKLIAQRMGDYPLYQETEHVGV